MRNVLEQEEQKALVSRCRLEGLTIISIENSLQMPVGGFMDIVRNYVTKEQSAKILIFVRTLISKMTKKKYVQGMLVGCPDLFIPELKLFIEMKRRDGGICSKEQFEVHTKLRNLGYNVEICHGAKKAWAIIEEIRGNKK